MSFPFQSSLRGLNNQTPSAPVPSSLRSKGSRSSQRLACLPVLQMLLLPILLVLCLQTATVSAQVDVGGFVDPTFCLNALYESDSFETGGDENGVIDREEYVTFAKLQGPSGFLNSVDSYIEMPAAFKLAFGSLACLCDNPEFGGDETDPGCCLGLSAGIRIPVDPGGSETDALYLYVICARTGAATEIVLNSLAPTMMPTDDPTPAPTFRPTLAPTRGPTFAPTRQPTLAPTRGPTLAPTMRPTPGPTFAPTLAPTMAPTLRPTVQPTLRPTLAPTETPTQAPILPGSPTRSPVTGTPSVEPTNVPTAQPSTRSPTKQPTLAPTFAPSPTFAPTPTPAPNTAVPTVPSLQALATVVYQIGVLRGTAEMDYVADLQEAMNDLAFQVGMETFPPPTDGGRRRLLVMVEIPTFGRVVDNIGTYSDVLSLLLVLC
jgi:hypothetical protein